MLEPLKGVRLLQLGNFTPGAFAARLLGDLGAEVIKVDLAGTEAPSDTGTDEVAEALSAYLNWGKRSVRVDAGRPDGADLLRRLAEASDLLIYDPDDLPGGFDPRQDWPGRPATVAVSTFGATGPRAGQLADRFVLEHLGGFAFHQAAPVKDPETTPPLHCADMESALVTGLVAANAALSLPLDRPGPLIDVSQEDVMAYLLVEPFAMWLDGLPVTERRREEGSRVTVAGGLIWLLPCADGAILVSPREDHQWDRWVEVMGRPAWTGDASLCGDRYIRTANALALSERMSEWSRTQSNTEVSARAQASRVACFPVSTARSLLQNEQLLDRGFFNSLRLRSGRTIPLPGLPFKMTSQSGATLDRATTVVPPRPVAVEAALSGTAGAQTETAE